MTSKKFIVISTVLILILLSLQGLFFYQKDFFALFHKSTSQRIWGLEKTSKYLLAHKYIPENFDALLIGPSMSANLNPEELTGANFYNLSMQGGNVTEVKAALDVALSKGSFKYLIICLYPFFTKDHGIKGAQISEKEYWGSLFSFLPLRILWMQKGRLKDPNQDEFRKSEKGWNHFNSIGPKIDFSELIKEEDDTQGGTINIDSTAVSEFGT